MAFHIKKPSALIADVTVYYKEDNRWTDDFERRVIYENDDFVCLHRFSRVIDDEVFFSLMTAVNYKDGKVITQETIREPLDEDPSEGQDWNWEDYE